MYMPKYFKINDDEEIYDIIDNNGFAMLISQHEGEPFATHLPLELYRDENALYGHFARPNDQWKDIENQPVLAVFHGPHCYISPSWYETNKAVPTWNYVAVHVYGELEILKDEQKVIQSLHDLVNKYEKPDSTYKLTDLEPGFIEGMSKGIVGFKIKITRIEGKAKLSQNHPGNRRQLVIDALEKSEHENNMKIAELMKKTLMK